MTDVPDTLSPPTITVTQPERDPVRVGTADFKLFAYSVKVLCGEQQAAGCCGCAPVRPGRYATEINIHNPGAKEARVLLRPIPLVLAGAASGRAPAFNAASKSSSMRLAAHSATMTDCCRISELLFGAPVQGSLPLTIGMLEVLSTAELAVTAVYTASEGSMAPALVVNQIVPRLLSP